MDVLKVKLWTSIADVILISSDSSDVESHGKKTCNANLMADLSSSINRKNSNSESLDD